MSATAAVRSESLDANMAATQDKKPATPGETAKGQAKDARPGATAEARLAVALEALTAIAGENDLTCLGALFRMRRRAEEALFRIRATRDAG